MDKEIKTEMKARVILVTGGQRSGKSEFAEKLALNLSEHPAYLATSIVEDEEMRKRVEKHKERRQLNWRNMEEPFELSSVGIKSNETVLIDCLTLWASNWFFKLDSDVDAALAAMRRELDSLLCIDATLIFVTNEIGLGGVSPNALQRRFTDLQGYINQYVASKANEVYFLVSGIPMKIK